MLLYWWGVRDTWDRALHWSRAHKLGSDFSVQFAVNMKAWTCRRNADSPVCRAQVSVDERVLQLVWSTPAPLGLDSDSWEEEGGKETQCLALLS